MKPACPKKPPRTPWLITGIGLALVLAQPAHAGELEYQTAVFASEVVNPRGDTDFTLPAGTLDYVLGAALNNQPLTLRFELGRMRLRTPVGPERLTFISLNPESADAQVVIEPSAGGAQGDDFVAFSVLLSGRLAPGDIFALDMEGLTVRVAAANLPLAPNTALAASALLSNPAGEVDRLGNRQTNVLALIPCITASMRPGSRALAATPQPAFIGLPRSLDATTWLDLAFQDCLRQDGQPVREMEDVGRVLITISAPPEAIASIELPGLGLFGWDGAAFQLDLLGGPIGYSGPVRILVDGDTPINERVFVFEIRFFGRNPGNERRLIGPADLTRWEPIDRRQIVDVVPVEPGPDCAAGGVRFNEGRDLDYNGRLDEDEIEDVQWVCNGETGTPGANGFTVLQTATEDPPTATCPDGGWRVASGLDIDRNGSLGINEVQQEVLLCHGNDGSDGLVGPGGPQGRTGPAGPQGPSGMRGAPGLSGQSGSSADDGCRQTPGGSGAFIGLILLGILRRRR